MAEKALTDPSFVEAIELANDDLLFAETIDGPRGVKRNSAMPKRGAFSLISSDVVDINNDRVWILVASDGRLREISVREFIFGNFGNTPETDDFTLIPGTHNVRPVQLGEALPDVVSTITLDGLQPNIGGCSFLLVNTRNAAITVTTAGGITLFVEGTATDGSIAARQAATINVFNDGSGAVFSGG